MGEKTKLVFYHLPKTAGTSVSALWKSNNLPTQEYGKVSAAQSFFMYSKAVSYGAGCRISGFRRVKPTNSFIRPSKTGL